MDVSELKALVVDDHMIVRCDIERHIKSLGIAHVEQAANVREATDRMAQSDYNVIFLDWNMPGRSGYNLLEQCRGDAKYDNTAFVIVSAESEDRFIIEALKAGATSYIVKPVSENILREHVLRVVNWINARVAETRQTA
ncbi:MAG TPA: response regulator [Patescibacteria group bacterium]|nr:response regulator [Patescibacteria group bacterium]